MGLERMKKGKNKNDKKTAAYTLVLSVPTSPTAMAVSCPLVGMICGWVLMGDFQHTSRELTPLRQICVSR